MHIGSSYLLEVQLILVKLKKNLLKDIGNSKKFMINPAYRLLFICNFRIAKFEYISDIKIYISNI